MTGWFFQATVTNSNDQATAMTIGCVTTKTGTDFSKNRDRSIFSAVMQFNGLLCLGCHWVSG